MPRRLLTTLALLALGAQPAGASQPQFWKIEGAQEFLEGTLEGLGVDSTGHVRLAPAARLLHDTDAPDVWSIARDPKGTVYAGTGNEGRIFKIQEGKGALFFKAGELEVHALAFGPDGRLYAGTSPDGKVYAIDASGKATTFFDPADKYIWALAFDAQGNLFVATGAEGKVYRVDRSGKGVALFTSGETHITALTLDSAGNVYAGSSPGGNIYRIDKAGKVFVLYDSPYREVSSLDVGPSGTVYAAVVDGVSEKEEGARPPAPPPPPPAAGGGAEVIVTETITALPAALPAGPALKAPELSRPGTRGAILAILPGGEVETLWSSNEELPHALAHTPDGVLFGTGPKGKVYRVRDNQTWAMVLPVPVLQVTGVALAPGGGVLLATSNPGRVYTLEPGPGPRGTFTSRVKDADTASSWGRLRWTAAVPAGAGLEVATRSGNTRTPDSTWTAWSKPYLKKEGEVITSDRARFLQVRAVLMGTPTASPVLDGISAAYLQRNLRPQVLTITLHPPGEVIQKPLSVSGEVEILGQEPGEASDRPGAAPRPSNPLTPYARKLFQKGMQTLSWKAEDPNGDTLVYTVEYRSADDARFHLLRKGLTEPVLAWDTSTVPSGRYVVRVTASDSPGNPEGLALTGQKESAPFDVDNTPPVITATLLSRSPARVRAVVKDDSSIIRKTEYSLDGTRWHEVYPVDGINDSLEETYEIALGELAPGEPHTVVVRSADLFGNVSTARVDLP